MEKRYHQGACTIETRDDGKPRIVGYGSVFFRADDPGTQYELFPKVLERVSPKAFDLALQRKDDARGLFNHDPSHVLGRLSAGTLRLSVDSRGLRYEIDPPDTQSGRDVVELIRRGDISGSSFSFSVDKQSWEERADGTEIRTIEAVTLYDVGPVTFPAYEAASTAVRAATDCDSARTSLETWRRWKRDGRLREIALDIRR
jgi:HK97 family phage prohead protease